MIPYSYIDIIKEIL